MAPRVPPRCGVCTIQGSKYSCPSCLIAYCSAKCFKDHKDSCRGSDQTRVKTSAPLKEDRTAPLETEAEQHFLSEEGEIADALTLKPLTSLKWPYIPEEPSYADPLTKDEPKTLQLYHYLAIATSPSVRLALSSNPSLLPLLRKVDKLRGTEREEALERLLGVTTDRIMPLARINSGVSETEESIKAFEQLAEAIEKAVRDKKGDALGLDWAGDN